MKLQSLLSVGAAFSAAVLAFATLQSVAAKSDLQAVGTVEGHATTLGFIVGVRWGEGILNLEDGSQHKFTAKGAKLLETGVAEVNFKDHVYNLEKFEDFKGDYGAVSGGLTVIKGITGRAVLSNDNCVYINVEAESEGVRLATF